MITRQFGDGGWRAGCANAPPPLHVVDDNGQNWCPLPRVVLRPTPPGPTMIYVPVVAPFGDDPTDPAAQTELRIGTGGMIGRFNIGPRGERR